MVGAGGLPVDGASWPPQVGDGPDLDTCGLDSLGLGSVISPDVLGIAGSLRLCPLGEAAVVAVPAIALRRGPDVALETADTALMTDDLTRLGTTIRLARKAERIIRANIAFALLTKVVFVVFAVLGLATLWMAVLADMGASLLVVLNGLRALRD